MGGVPLLQTELFLLLFARQVAVILATCYTCLLVSAAAATCLSVEQAPDGSAGLLVFQGGLLMFLSLKMSMLQDRFYSYASAIVLSSVGVMFLFHEQDNGTCLRANIHTLSSFYCFARLFSQDARMVHGSAPVACW